MSGHSKWSKVKHQKAVTDAVKGREFTKASRAITIAVREAGGVTDPQKNFRLRLAVEKARSVNMPKDTIERAIVRGKGEEGAPFESVLYDIYGPGGVAILVEAATDNKTRTVSAIKNVLDQGGARLATPGAVRFLFVRTGVIVVPKARAVSFDRLVDLAIETGADDVGEAEDAYEIYAKQESLTKVKQRLEGEGIPIDNEDFVMKPKTTVDVTGDIRTANDKLKERLESLEDVQRIYENMTEV